MNLCNDESRSLYQHVLDDAKPWSLLHGHTKHAHKVGMIQRQHRLSLTKELDLFITHLE